MLWLRFCFVQNFETGNDKSNEISFIFTTAKLGLDLMSILAYQLIGGHYMSSMVLRNGTVKVIESFI